MRWRPEGWGKTGKPEGYDDYYIEWQRYDEGFEAGADAMLDVILQTWICYIPDGINLKGLEKPLTHVKISRTPEGCTMFCPDNLTQGI